MCMILQNEYFFVCSACSVDNSDYMRNGDFVPTRMQAQQDAVNLVCMSKTRSNPENNVGLLKMSSYVYIMCDKNQNNLVLLTV